ncbi:MAG: hypothetical protein V6Z78_04405 [Holosporaceae bacterium]
MIDDRFAQWTDALKGRLLGQPAYGWHQKSKGQRFLLNGLEFWAQLSVFATHKESQDFIQRTKDKDRLFLKAPTVHHIYWIDQYHVGCLMTFIPSSPFSNHILLQPDAVVTPAFFADLARSLLNLSKASSKYISCTQELITQRLNTYYPQQTLTTKITSWATIHGDMHWANLTKNGTMLDWETWGQGPRDLDPAFLYAFSIQSDETQHNIRRSFPTLFNTQDGQLCLLFACAEFVHMVKQYGDHADLLPQVTLLANTTLLQLKQNAVSP